MWIQCKIKWMRLNNIIIIVEKITHVLKKQCMWAFYCLVNTIVTKINKLFTPIICLMMLLQIFCL